QLTAQATEIAEQKAYRVQVERALFRQHNHIKMLKLDASMRKAAILLTQALRKKREERAKQGPMGVITLLCTAVQNSSALWDRNADLMRESVHLHNHLMRRLILKHQAYAL